MSVSYVFRFIKHACKLKAQEVTDMHMISGNGCFLLSRNGMGAGGLVGDTAHIPDDGTAREAAPAGPITSTGSEISRDPPKVTFSSSQDSDGLSGQLLRR